MQKYAITMKYAEICKINFIINFKRLLKKIQKYEKENNTYAIA